MSFTSFWVNPVSFKYRFVTSLYSSTKGTDILISKRDDSPIRDNNRNEAPCCERNAEIKTLVSITICNCIKWYYTRYRYFCPHKKYFHAVHHCGGGWCFPTRRDSRVATTSAISGMTVCMVSNVLQALGSRRRGVIHIQLMMRIMMETRKTMW